MSIRRWVLVAPVLFAAAPPRAEACQPATCSDAIRVGEAPPANLGGLVFAPGFRERWDAARVPDFALVDAAGGSTLTTRLEALGGGRYLARIASALIPGRAYRASFDQACGAGARSFRAGPSAPPPTTLGTLRVEQRQVGLFDTDLLENVGADPERCRTRESYVAWAVVRLDAAPELGAWADALEIETVVDGVVQADPPPGEVWSAPGKAFGVNRYGFFAAPVWLPCGSDGRARGTREVRMRAWSEALGVRVETPPLLVELSCVDDAEAPPGREDAGPLGEVPPSCGSAKGAPGDTLWQALLALALLVASRARESARRRPASVATTPRRSAGETLHVE